VIPSTGTPPQVPQSPPTSAQVGGGSDGSADLSDVPSLPRPDEMCRPESYAVERDLSHLLTDCKRCSGRGTVRDVATRVPKRCKHCHGRGRGIRGFARAHSAELKQRERVTGLNPTTIALMALALGFHGLPGAGARGQPVVNAEERKRRRLNGKGLQLPLRFLRDLLGRDKATICRALGQGIEAGVLERYAPVVSVETATRGRLQVADVRRSKADGGGREQRERINVHGVLYLTGKGARILADLGRIRVAGVEKVGGVVGFLLRILAPVIRLMARRSASVDQHATPYGGSTTEPLGDLGTASQSSYPSSPPAALLDMEGRRSTAPPLATAGSGGRVLVALGRAWVDVPRRVRVAVGLEDAPAREGWPRTLDALTRAELALALHVCPGPESMWPTLWAGSDMRGRQWLALEYERLRAKSQGRRWHPERTQRPQAGRGREVQDLRALPKGEPGPAQAARRQGRRKT
jgi:hypothetical protein